MLALLRNWPKSKTFSINRKGFSIRWLKVLVVCTVVTKRFTANWPLSPVLRKVSIRRTFQFGHWHAQWIFDTSFTICPKQASKLSHYASVHKLHSLDLPIKIFSLYANLVLAFLQYETLFFPLIYTLWSKFCLLEIAFTQAVIEESLQRGLIFEKYLAFIMLCITLLFT